MEITKETRLQSYFDMLGKRANKYKQIIEILYEKQLTAKEVAVRLYEEGYSSTNERNVSAPRLNELVKLNIVRVVGKKKCAYTNKLVAVYELI